MHHWDALDWTTAIGTVAIILIILAVSGWHGRRPAAVFGMDWNTAVGIVLFLLAVLLLVITLRK